MKFKSHFNYIILILGILLLFFTSILLVINWLVTENIEKQIESKIYQAQFHVESHILQTIENKIEICKTIANNEILISAVDNIDSLTLDSMVQKIYDFEHNDYFLITDAESKILKRLNQTNGAKDYLYLLPDVFDFLSEKLKTKQHFKISHLINKDKFYLICTVPIYNNSIIIGTLSKDYNLEEIWDLTKYSDMDFTFFDRKKILFSTMQIQSDLFEQFFNIHIPVFDAVLATSQPSEMLNTTLGDKEIYSKIIPFGYGIPVSILISVQESDEYAYLDTLVEHLIYIFIFFSISLLITLFVILNHRSKQVDNLNLEPKNDINNNVPEREDSKEVKGTILASKIIYAESELNISEEDIFSSYHLIQSELIELYDGKIENIKNNQIIASFAGNEDSIEKSVQCAQSIVKLISKESKTTNCQIAIGINYGTINYSDEQNPVISGETSKIAVSISDVAKPGQILIQNNQISNVEIEQGNFESEKWKLKNLENEVRLVNLAGYLK